jgi:lipoprotein-releasing system ATP-binding protein
VREVAKSYDTPHHRIDVLRGISFDLEPGQALAVVGPSGSGKSTLLHCMGTLERPSSGEILLGDVRPLELPEPELAAFRNRQVGFVFQDHHLLPQYSVLDNVLLPTAAGDGTGADERQRAEALLREVGLADRLSHRPAELSGGERQRVAIARALINRPSLLLCDEPTGNLDRATASTVADLLFGLHRDASAILVVVTHSQELAARCGRRFELREGRCVPA